VIFGRFKKYKFGMNAPPIWKSFVLGGKFCEGRVSGVSLWRPMALQDFAVAVVVGEQDNKEGGTHRHDRHGSHAQVKDMRAPTTPNCGKKMAALCSVTQTITLNVTITLK